MRIWHAILVFMKISLNIWRNKLRNSDLRRMLWHLWQQKDKNSWLRVRTRTRERTWLGDFSHLVRPQLLPSLFLTHVFEKQRIIFNKTTCHFQQNNVSFSTKQRVVFNKTTCHFQQNDVSFSIKQAVTFHKTTHPLKTKTDFSLCGSFVYN